MKAQSYESISRDTIQLYLMDGWRLHKISTKNGRVYGQLYKLFKNRKHHIYAGRWSDDFQQIYDEQRKKSLICPDCGREFKNSKSLGSHRARHTTGDFWSKDEIELLKNHYSTETRSNLLKMFPNRSAKQIRGQAQTLGLKKRDTWAIEKWQLLKLADTDAKYIAGIIDCEGTVTLTIRTMKGWTLLRPQITILNNTEKGFVEHCKKIVRIGTISSKSPQGFGKKPTYTLVLTNFGDCYGFLKRIKKYLVVKKQHAEIVLEWLNHRRQRLEKISRSTRLPADKQELKLLRKIRNLG